jgi:hypothetical protein
MLTRMNPDDPCLFKLGPREISSLFGRPGVSLVGSAILGAIASLYWAFLLTQDVDPGQRKALLVTATLFTLLAAGTWFYSSVQRAFGWAKFEVDGIRFFRTRFLTRFEEKLRYDGIKRIVAGKTIRIEYDPSKCTGFFVGVAGRGRQRTATYTFPAFGIEEQTRLLGLLQSRCPQAARK